MFYQLLKVQRFFELLYQTGISLLRILLRFKYKNLLKPHLKRGTKLIVLGNGPSLKETLQADLEILKGAELLAVNQFALTEQFEEYQPQHYVLLDIGFFNKKTLPRVEEIRQKLITAFVEKTKWSLKLYVPNEAKGSELHRGISSQNKLVEFVFFNRTNVTGLKRFRHWAYRKNLGMPAPQNVLVACISLALVLRFSEVYLLGADHSWLENIRVSEDNELISIEKHFYDKDKKGVPTKREHPDTLQKSYLHDYLYDLSRTFSSYHILADFAATLGVRVWNATPGSYIDAFERFK